MSEIDRENLLVTHSCSPDQEPCGYCRHTREKHLRTGECAVGDGTILGSCSCTVFRKLVAR